jgi:hypothetical protein
MLLVKLLLVSGRRLFRNLIDFSFLIFSHFLSLKPYSDTSVVIIIIIIIIIITITIIKVLNQQVIER